MTNQCSSAFCNSDIEAHRMYTRHGEKHLFGHPLRFHGGNALAWWKDGVLLGFIYQEEIDDVFNDPNIPEYNQL